MRRRPACILAALLVVSAAGLGAQRQVPLLCHEGNDGLVNVLTAARSEEADK
jgi:hypothetical protein